ncbi:unnamed protein product [Amoebophrya sp. A25]|nr:unnamed protein product [Amoebophrya sp. A25]|eukprot:GSA25T00015209001.1
MKVCGNECRPVAQVCNCHHQGDVSSLSLRAEMLKKSSSPTQQYTQANLYIKSSLQLQLVIYIQKVYMGICFNSASASAFRPMINYQLFLWMRRLFDALHLVIMLSLAHGVTNQKFHQHTYNRVR